MTSSYFPFDHNRATISTRITTRGVSRLTAVLTLSIALPKNSETRAHRTVPRASLPTGSRQHSTRGSALGRRRSSYPDRVVLSAPRAPLGASSWRCRWQRHRLRLHPRGPAPIHRGGHRRRNKIRRCVRGGRAKGFAEGTAEADAWKSFLYHRP